MVVLGQVLAGARVVQLVLQQARFLELVVVADPDFEQRLAAATRRQRCSRTCAARTHRRLHW
ncbi:MAG: hypothetical protein ABI699_01170 [Caldimonas sp.]